VSGAAHRFDTQPEQTISAAQTVTISNTGNAPLSIRSLLFSAQTRRLLDRLRRLPGRRRRHRERYSLTIEFAPQVTGARSATLKIASRIPASPAIVTLSGTGGQLPQGRPTRPARPGRTDRAARVGPPDRSSWSCTRP
jgi:hypothetical protein